MNKEEQLNIISINIDGNNNAVKDERKQRRIKFLQDAKNQEIDILACQEIPKKFTSENEIKDNIEGNDLECKGRSAIFTGFYVVNEKYRSGIVTPNRVEEIWNKFIKYPNITKSFRTGYWCEKRIRFLYEDIYIINIHISTRYSLMLKVSLLLYLDELKGKNVILLGDFNAAEKNDTEKYIEENDEFLKEAKNKGYLELRSKTENENGIGHYTHYHESKGRKLDHIFVSESFENKFACKIDYMDEINYTHPQKNDNMVFTDHSGIKLSVYAAKN